VDQSFVKVHFNRMTIEYSNWLVNKIADKEADMVAMRKHSSETIKKDTRLKTMSLKGGSKTMKYLAQTKSINNQRRKD